MELELVFTLLEGFSLKLQSATVDRVPLGDGVERWTVTAGSVPKLNPTSNALVRQGDQPMADVLPRMDVTVRSDGAANRFRLVDGVARVWLLASDKLRVTAGEAAITAQGLLVSAPAGRFFVTPGSSAPTLELPLALRIVKAAWQYRLLPGRPVGWSRGGSLETALEPTLKALVQIQGRVGLERVAVEVEGSEWQSVPASDHWPSTFRLGRSVVTLPDVPMLLAPDLLRIAFENPAVAVFTFQEGPDPATSQADVSLDRDRLTLRKALRFVAVPATSEAPPDGPARLWLRSDQGWLSIQTGDGSPKSPGLRWGEQTGYVETREVTLEPGETAGGRVSVLLDRTGTSRLVLRFPIPAPGGAPSLVERAMSFFDAGVRVLTPHHLSTGRGQRVADLVPYFDELSKPPVYDKDKAPRSDALFEDGAGRTFERLMLLTENLCKPAASTLGATIQVVTVGADSDLATSGSLSAGPVLEIELNPEPGWVVAHHRPIQGVPCAVPVEWAANDPDAGARPSPLRGLSPVRFDGVVAVKLRVDPRWFSLRIEPMKKALGLEKPPAPWGMWPVRKEHLGLEITPAAPGPGLAAGVRVRHALPHLDAAYQAAGLAGLTEAGRDGSERVDGEYALSDPRTIPDLDQVAAAPEGADPLAAAARLRAFDAARALDAAPRDGKSDKLISLLVDARNMAAADTMSVPVFRLLLWLRGQSLRSFSVVAPDGGPPTLFGSPLLPIDVSLEGDLCKVRTSYGPFDRTPASDLTFEIGFSGLSGTVPLRGVKGTLVLPASFVLGRLPGAKPPPPSDNPGLLFVESTSMKHGFTMVGGNPTLDLLARDLTCTVRCGTEILRSRTSYALTLAGAGATLDGPAEEDPSRALTASATELSLTLTHRLPGLTIREICGTAGYRIEVQAGAVNASFAEGSGSPDPGKGISVTKSYQRVFVTGAPAAAIEPPVRPVPAWNVEVRSLTRCHLLLSRRGTGPNADLLQLERGVLGYVGGTLFGADPVGTGERAPQVTLTVPGGGKKPSLSFSGLWRHTRALRLNDAPPAQDVSETMTLILWEPAPGDVARARAARLLLQDTGQPGLSLKPLFEKSSLELAVRYEIKRGANPSWISLQTARIQPGGQTLDLSATHALVAYPGAPSITALVSRRPGLVLGLCPPPRPGDDVKTALLRWPASTSDKLLSARAPASTTAHYPSVSEPLAGARPWLPGPEGDPGSLAAVVAAGAGDNAEAAWQSALDGPEGLLRGNDLFASAAWAGHTLYRRRADETAWVASGLCSADLRDGVVESTGPVVWVFGEAGLQRLHTFPPPDPTKPPTPPVAETKAILASARWHEVAVLEWRDKADKLFWDLVDSPLLDRFKSLDPVTFAGTFSGRSRIEPSPRKMPDLPPEYHLLADGDCQIDCRLPPAPGEKPTADRWIPPYVGLGVQIQPPKQATKGDVAYFTIDRAVPFRFDQTHPLTPCDPFDATTAPLPRPERVPAKPGTLPYTPPALELSPYAPRPSERTGFGVALTVVSAPDKGGNVFVSNAPSAVLRAPPAFDDQAAVRADVSRPVQDAFERRDGLVTRTVRWSRRHPTIIDLGDPTKPVALALGSPEARVTTGAPVLLRVLLNKDNLKRYYDANKPPEAANNPAWLVLAFTKNQDTNADMGSLQETGAAFQRTLRVKLLRLDTPIDRDKIDVRVTFRDTAEDAWITELQLSCGPNGTKNIQWAAASANGAPPLLVTRAPVPKALTGVLRTGKLDKRKLVAYGPEALAWTADFDPEATSPKVVWEASSEVLDRSSDKDSVKYEVVSLMSDGSFSASEAVAAPSA
ncbi:MAG: hypothetical protein U0441_09185 [Polyangiaceae bacterium]